MAKAKTKKPAAAVESNRPISLANIQLHEITAIVYFLKEKKETAWLPEAIAAALQINLIRVQIYLGFLSDDEISKVRKLPTVPPTYQYVD